MSVSHDNFIRYEVTVTRGCCLCLSLHHLFIFSTFENVLILMDHLNLHLLKSLLLACHNIHTTL